MSDENKLDLFRQLCTEIFRAQPRKARLILRRNVYEMLCQEYSPDTIQHAADAVARGHGFPDGAQIEVQP